ncbi:MAG: hypothetical protein JWO82_155, partial [Akkermansiaceae bacterium]|nr:hypothetical protein [Akkermansiaceae bacterium]
GSPDEALPFLVSSLQSDSRNLEAQALLLSTLRQTGWHVPVLHLKLPQTVHQLAFGPETDTLFAAADGEGKPGSFQALMRWDLDTATLSAVLSPVWGSQQTGALSISPDGRHLIMRRGDASQTTTLLCDSLTMAVESKLTPAKSMDGFCWSPDGLLFGYVADDDKGGILWRICDTASGAVIRESESFPNLGWSAVTLGRTNLRAVAKDGTVVEVPLNPKFPTRGGRLDAAPVAVAFSPDGSEILAEFAGAGAARRGVYSIADSPEGGALDVKPVPDGAAHEWTTGSSLLEQLPWARGKGSMAPVVARARRLDFTGSSDFFQVGAAPFRESGEIEAVASIGKKIAISSGGGEVTLHEWLPPLAEETPKPDPAKGQAEWIPMGSSASGILEKNGTAWRLNRGKDAVVALAPEIRAAAANPKGDRIVVGGSAGLWSVDAGSGEVLSSTLPVEDVREIVFLADGKRIAVAGATEVVVLELLEDGFERLASLPITGATGLKELAVGKLLAVANSTEIGLFETQRFSRTGTLAISAGAGGGELAWAEDREHGWLACARGPRLDVWSLRSGRPLAMSLPLAATPRRMEFQAQGDQWGVLCDGGFFVPLARVSGLTSGELAALQSLAEAVSGTRLDGVSRAIDFLSSEERKAAAAKADVTVLIRLLPGSALVREKFATLNEREAQPEALAPLWNGLAFSPGADGLKIARWAEELGKDQPWYRAFVRGLIAESDRKLYEGKITAPDEGIADLRRMAGEDEATRKLMKAAWLSRDRVPAHRERREAALPVLNDRIAVTAASYEASRTSANAIAHAEALALRNDPETPAAAFLTGKVGAEEDLTLEQAHFLIASGLAATCTPAIDRSLKALQSPWLWIAWLELQAGQDRTNLPGRIQQVMMEAGGRGPVAAKALGAAFKAESPEAIAMALAQSKGMPPQLVEYATGRALWLQGKKAEVFAMWPQGPPDLQKLAESGGWNGWEQAVGWEQAARFSAEVAEELGTLKVQPGDTIETQRALAAKLMDPKTAAAFGGKRVRDAMVDLALVLASDKGSSAVVMKMIERARLTGADPVMCLRAEARNLYAMGQPTSAYSRWIQILDAPESGLIGTDCIEAAQCLVQDQQDAAAVELLMRGPNLFPHDAVFAYQAAWMLLGMNHPEQANLVLDYGFRIPFAQDQIQMATAMQVCAAELTQRSDQANQAFRELVQFDPSWGNAANLKQLDWPQQLKQAIMVVAGRNHR